MRGYYVTNSQSHDTDTPTYMEALSCEHEYEQCEVMDDEIQSLIRKDTWEIVSMKSVADHNVFPGTSSFKCKKKPDWTIRKFKAQYFVRGGIQKRLSPKPLNSYSPVVQGATVRLRLQDKNHDPDTPTYMEALSGENSEEYFKAMDDEIQSLMRRDT